MVTTRKLQVCAHASSISFFFRSLEWDLMELNSARHEKIYAGCCGQDFYIDITFKIEIRRKTLFYTINLMIPCTMFGMFFLNTTKSYFECSSTKTKILHFSCKMQIRLFLCKIFTSNNF